MRDLALNEVLAISGGRIRPEYWTISAAFGALVGAACFTLTAFTSNPVNPFAAIALGAGIGAGLHATGDILHSARHSH